MIRRENLQVGKAVRKDSWTGVFNRYISLSFDSSTFEKRGEEQKRQPNLLAEKLCRQRNYQQRQAHV